MCANLAANALAGLLCLMASPEPMAQGVPGNGGTAAPTFTFEMRGKPWASVFEWLTDKTGTPFISQDVPTGTLNFIAKKDQRFTIPQVVDIINDGLILQKYVLIRRNTSFTVIPADKEIDAALVPLIAPDELTQHGKTEIVALFVKLRDSAQKTLRPMYGNKWARLARRGAADDESSALARHCGQSRENPGRHSRSGRRDAKTLALASAAARHAG